MPGMTELLVLLTFYKLVFETNNKTTLKHEFFYKCVMQAVTHMHVCMHFYELRPN